MNIFVSIFVLLCHLLFLLIPAWAQVPSPLHPPLTVDIKADSQEKAGDVYHMTGHVDVTYAGMRITADRMDYDTDTGEIVAKGNVHYTRPQQHEDIWAAEGTYNLRNDTASYANVVGSVGARVRGRASLLTTTNPFFFVAERVDKTDADTYRLWNATITVCSLPDPTWTFAASEATVHPDENAWIHHSKLRLLKLPVFYFPVFYRSLQQIPRSSGFLTPMFGNSSTLGVFLGDSFYWAINRSTDAELGAELLSKRGWEERGAFRWRPATGDYLNVTFFAVEDRGIGTPPVKQGGQTASAQGLLRLPDDIRGVLDVNYLSSLLFREAFTQSFNEAVFSENHSTGFLTKSIGPVSFNSLLSSLQDFQSTTPKDVVNIRHLPEIQVNSLEQPLWQNAPVWISWDDSIGVVSRSEPTLPAAGAIQNTGSLGRYEFDPRVTVPLQWEDFHLTSTFGYRARYYGEQLLNGTTISDKPLNSDTEELSVELALPALSKVYAGAGRLYPHPFKHVIEPLITFNYVNGERDFNNTLLFDEGDLVNNTRQLELSITNRILAKRQTSSAAQEVLSWQVKQQYYFDPTFGGAVQADQRNVFLSTLDFDGNSFISGPRRFSPIVSIFRFRPFAHYDVEFRQDYDTTLRRLTNAEYLGNISWGHFFGSVGEFVVRTPVVLSSPSDQMHFTAGYGNLSRVGFNAVFTTAYDIRAGAVQFSAFQVSYNNNCCGISVEFRRFALGAVRNENQYRLSFTLANIGSFGNMKKQERLF